MWIELAHGQMLATLSGTVSGAVLQPLQPAESGKDAPQAFLQDLAGVTAPALGMSYSNKDERLCCVGSPVVANTGDELICGTLGAYFPEKPPGGDATTHRTGPMMGGGIGQGGDRFLVESYVPQRGYCPNCMVHQYYRIIGGTPGFIACVVAKNEEQWAKWYTAPNVRRTVDVPKDDRWAGGDTVWSGHPRKVSEGGLGLDLPPRARCCTKTIRGAERSFLAAVDRPGGFARNPACGPNPQGVIFFRTEFWSHGARGCDYSQCIVDWLFLYERNNARVKVIQSACRETGNDSLWVWGHPPAERGKKLEKAPEQPVGMNERWKEILDEEEDWRRTLMEGWMQGLPRRIAPRP